jgi:hypothetical protein
MSLLPRKLCPHCPKCFNTSSFHPLPLQLTQGFRITRQTHSLGKSNLRPTTPRTRPGLTKTSAVMASAAMNGSAKGPQNVPFHTPAQKPPAGTALSTGPDVPTLFTPFRLRALTLQNRFVVSPMCMYSADDGHLTDFHLAHLGAFSLRGAALTFIEATSVTAVSAVVSLDGAARSPARHHPL